MRLHHIALRVADCERAAAFYARLDLVEMRRFSEPAGLRAVWLQAGDLVLMLERHLRGAGPQEGTGHLLAFEVEDLRAWEERLARAGIAVEDRTEHTLYLRDPDGHRVGLTTYRFEPLPA